MCRASLPNAESRSGLQAVRNLVVQLGTQMRGSGLDCSHFVHAVYEQAGLPYDYATSRRLYRGLDGFQRVIEPRPGDLAVWPGHVGIVVRPEQKTFLSAIASGVKLSSYASPYWKKKGIVHFFRYV
jgi:cell wall-associated NlpC family hydrolase